MGAGKAKEKTERVLKALSHQEPDRVPITDFFWGAFVSRWRQEKGLPLDADIYEHYDLDLVHVNPNMDPHIVPATVVEETPEFVIYRTGFGYTVKKNHADPMPAFLDFSVKTVEEMRRFQFDDPADARRYFAPRQDALSAGDGVPQTYPSFMDAVNRYRDGFCVVGSVCEAYEALWRIVGYENALIWTATNPEAIREFNERVIDFMIEIGNQQIRLAGVLALIVWGDVAYRNGMMFSPRKWRELFYPGLARMCQEFKRHGVKLIYHGCGDARAIYEDMIGAGIDAYNSMEVRAGIDVVQLKRQYGTRLAYNGNISVETLERGNRAEIRAEVLRKLNAAKGGGYIVSSDHSVSSGVSAASYDYLIELVRKFGVYPLRLEEFDEPV